MRPCASRAVVEHGTWLENAPLLKSFYHLLEIEFHMLAAQRGKGFFYTGAGVLTLFTEDTTFSFVGVASICLIVAGVFHSFRIVHEEPIGAKSRGQTSQGGMSAAHDASLPATHRSYDGAHPPAAPPPPPPLAAGSAANEWNSMVAAQNEREGAEAETWRSRASDEESADGGVAAADPARV